MNKQLENFIPEAKPDNGSRTFEFLVPGGEKYIGTGANGVGDDVDTSDYDERVRRAIVSAYEKGITKGLEEATFWKNKSTGELMDIIASLLEGKKMMLASLEGAMLKLSVSIAEKIVKREIEADVVDCLKKQIELCLKQLDRKVPVLIRLNPDDLPVVKELLDSAENPFPELNGVKLVEDRRVGRGGCIVETDKGALRATISEQIEKISQALESEYAKSITKEMGATPLDSIQA